MYAIAATVLEGKSGSPTTARQAQRRAATAAPSRPRSNSRYAERPQRDAVLDAARAALVDATQFVREKNIVTLPDEPLEIIVMPEFQQGVALAYCDSPGPLEAGQKTFYAVSPIPAQWTQRADRFIPARIQLALDSQPHHSRSHAGPLPAARACQQVSVDVAQRCWRSGPFIEGWAVYTERVMSEQGYMNGDPLMKLIQLKWYLRTIVNALLDQAVHVDGISREAAMKLLTESGFQEEREAAGKWTRAQLTSAQLPVYFVGAQEHIGVARRGRAARWAPRSNLREYHDKVLSYGSPPVRFARELMFDLPIE